MPPVGFIDGDPQAKSVRGACGDSPVRGRRHGSRIPALSLAHLHPPTRGLKGPSFLFFFQFKMFLIPNGTIKIQGEGERKKEKDKKTTNKESTFDPKWLFIRCLWDEWNSFRLETQMRSTLTLI